MSVWPALGGDCADRATVLSAGTTELDTVERLDANGKKWIKCCKLPLARSNAGACTLNDQIYCIGGWNGQTGIKQCDVYKPNDDKWTSISPLNTGRYQAGVTAFKNQIWAAGGSDAWTCLASVEAYDPDADKWMFAPPLLTPRRGCGLAEFNGKLYAVGGSDGTHSLSTTEIYDEETKTWMAGPSLTTPRANVSVVSVAGKLYAIGGFAGKFFLNTIEYLDPQTNEWTTFVKQNSNNHCDSQASTEIDIGGLKVDLNGLHLGNGSCAPIEHEHHTNGDTKPAPAANDIEPIGVNSVHANGGGAAESNGDRRMRRPSKGNNIQAEKLTKILEVESSNSS